MAEQYGMTNEERNKQHFKDMAEKSAERQKASKERFEKLSNGFAKSMAQYDVNDLTNTANGLLSGEITPDKFGVEKAIEFSGECRTAIDSLEKKLLTQRTTAGMLKLQGKVDAYKSKLDEIKDIEDKMTLFKNFI